MEHGDSFIMFGYSVMIGFAFKIIKLISWLIKIRSVQAVYKK